MLCSSSQFTPARRNFTLFSSFLLILNVIQGQSNGGYQRENLWILSNLKYNISNCLRFGIPASVLAMPIVQSKRLMTETSILTILFPLRVSHKLVVKTGVFLLILMEPCQLAPSKNFMHYFRFHTSYDLIHKQSKVLWEEAIPLCCTVSLLTLTED